MEGRRGVDCWVFSLRFVALGEPGPIRTARSSRPAAIRTETEPDHAAPVQESHTLYPWSECMDRLALAGLLKQSQLWVGLFGLFGLFVIWLVVWPFLANHFSGVV